MIEVEGKTIDILEQDWDLFLILDACRYDVFKKVYKNILKKEGKVKQAKTKCNCTKEWMLNNLKGKDCKDIIYIDPIILFEKYLAYDQFFKVIPVWKDKWDYHYGTIMPSDMTNSAIEQMRAHSNKRIIIHYHQPHPPFLNDEITKIRKSIITPEIVLARDNKKKDKTATMEHFIQGNMRRFLGAENAWKLLISLGIEPLDGMGQIYKHFGMDNIKTAYEENMKIVLRSIASFLQNNDKLKIIISSDHSYNYDRSRAKLRKRSVPWFEINGGS